MLKYQFKIQHEPWNLSYFTYFSRKNLFSRFAADYKLYKFKLEKQHDTKTFGVTFGGR